MILLNGKELKTKEEIEETILFNTNLDLWKEGSPEYTKEELEEILQKWIEDGDETKEVV